MKKILAAMLCMLLVLSCFSLAESRTTLEISDYFDQQAAIDAALLAEGEYGYSFEEPLVVVNPYRSSPLSAVAIFTTEEEIGGAVVAKGHAPEDDVTGSFPATATHYVPILGLYSGGVTEVELTLDDGRSTTLQVETEPVTIAASDIHAEMYDASAYDFSQLTVCHLIGNRGYGAFDSSGDLRWAILNTGFQGKVLLEDGHLLIGTAERYNSMNWWSNGLREVDALGRVYAEYIFPGGTHHDFIQLPNGNYMAVSNKPETLDSEDYIVEIDAATGEVAWELALDALLPTDDGAAFGQSEEDWAHINGVSYDAANDLVLISARHLDAIVAVRKQDKTLAWVLGDPTGWEKLDSRYLLTPVDDDFEWQYGQHEVTLLSDGTILVFDNGYGGRAKTVNADAALPNAENYSRAVRYKVDAEAMTVEQVWQYGKELGAKYYCSSRSGVICLDETSDSYLVDFGVCAVDYDGSLGVPGNCTYVQYVVDDAPVWELSYLGMTYRAFRGNLYDFGGHFDLTAAPVRHGRMSGSPALDMTVDLETAEALVLPLEIRMLPYNALRVAGNQIVATPPEGLGRYAVILVDSEGRQTAFDLFYYTAQDSLKKLQKAAEPVAPAAVKQLTEAVAANPDGTTVFLDAWVSTYDLPAGSYQLYLLLNDALFDTGLDVTAGGAEMAWAD